MEDPVWIELFKGNPEVDEGCILLSAQLMHERDLLYKKPAAELIPQAEGEAVFMREARIQMQILGLRDMKKELGLNNPCVYAYVQTTERWDGDDRAIFRTKLSKYPTPEDANFMEQAELQVRRATPCALEPLVSVWSSDSHITRALAPPWLSGSSPLFYNQFGNDAQSLTLSCVQVLLPDSEEFSPDLEFIVEDTSTWGGKRIVAWGSMPLKDLYPQVRVPHVYVPREHPQPYLHSTQPVCPMHVHSPARTCRRCSHTRRLAQVHGRGRNG
jgi:hypothetical protein